MKRMLQILMLLVASFGLTACVDETGSTKGAAPAGAVFNILAGSELKDVAPDVEQFARSQGVQVKFTYTGSLDAVDTLTSAHPYDAVWLSHGSYLQLVPQVKSQLKASEKTMYSRVVLGIKPDVAKRLGWKSGETGWKEIVAASKAGKFRFGMTNPTGSNTGFIALVGLAAELSGKGDALEEKDIPTAALTQLFAGQTMTAGSSGVLADLMRANPEQADGMVNYESVIRSVSTEQRPLEVLIPKEGVVTADYPLMLLSNSKSPAFYQKLVAHVRGDAFQKGAVVRTFRTPLTGSADDVVVNELPFPGSLNVVDAILRGFLDSYSRPVSSYFVLDTSGSMEGARMADMKAAMQALAQGDGSLTGRFATFRQREKVVLTTFSHEVAPKGEFFVGAEAKPGRDLAGLSKTVLGLEADGGTAIYSAILTVYDAAQAELKAGKRGASIVLLSDGESNRGASLMELVQRVQTRGNPRVPVYAILYGESNADEMRVLTETTGGRVFDARKVTLAQVMKNIRSYQ